MSYAKLIGKLRLSDSYCARLVITPSVNHLIRYMSHPTLEHWHQAKRALFYYIKGTLEKELCTPRVCLIIPNRLARFIIC